MVAEILLPVALEGDGRGWSRRAESVVRCSAMGLLRGSSSIGFTCCSGRGLGTSDVVSVGIDGSGTAWLGEVEVALEVWLAR